jgi:Ca2+/Na+ antiporter
MLPCYPIDSRPLEADEPGRTAQGGPDQPRDKNMLLAAFYVFAITAIILHYTGHLKRWNCEWILIVLAIAVFPAVLFL